MLVSKIKKIEGGRVITMYMKDSKTRDIETWTVKNRAGKTIAENIPDIVEWLKTHSDVFEVARLNAIKTLIIA